MDYTVKGSTTPTDEVLNYIAHMPTEKLADNVDPEFFKKLSDEKFMRIATLLAKKGYEENGCPIGGVIIDNATRQIIGKGHNTLMQENNSVVHGETSATIDAGRVAKLKGEGPVDFSKTTMFTTLTPCRVCCCQLNTRTRPSRVVIGDVTNAPSTAPRLSGMKVEILEDKMAIDQYREYAEKYPEKHYADWLGEAWYQQLKHLPPEELLQAAIEEVARLDAHDVQALRVMATSGRSGNTGTGKGGGSISH
jgi:creatinine deaminase